jgi:hypothetical protein
VVEFELFDDPADEALLEGLGVSETLVMKYLSHCIFEDTERGALDRLLKAAKVTGEANRDRVRSILGQLSKPRKWATAA